MLKKVLVLVVSVIMLFNMGVFAPGQGIFPKYTSGLYDGKLIVSRGLGNQTPYPRINNEEEIIVIDIVYY